MKAIVKDRQARRKAALYVKEQDRTPKQKKLAAEYYELREKALKDKR